MKRILNRFKPQYRLIQINDYYEYMIQRKSWYNLSWQNVKVADNLQTAKENFKLVVYGPNVIQTSANLKDRDEVY